MRVIQHTLDILTLIQAFYEGGLDQFRKDDGGLFLLPPPFNTIILYHPEIEDTLKQKIDERFKKASIKVEYSNKINFEGEDLSVVDEFHTSLGQMLQDFGLEEVDVILNPITLVLNFPVSKKDDRIEDIRTILKKNLGIARVDMAFKDGVETLIGRAQSMRNLVATSKGLERAIQDDDILNLRIDLECCETIEDFLERM